MTSERTDYGYDVICAGSYKHLKPQITTFVLFGEAKAVLLNIEDVGELYNFVADEVLIRLAGFAI